MKPLTRGYIHQVVFYVAICACAILITHSRGTLALISNIIYSITLIGLYGISALYHCIMWDRRTYLLLRSIDHAAIFALIAGSATPICLLGLKSESSLRFLAIMWVIAATGMILAIFWTQRPKWTRSFFYVAMGWLAIFYLPEIKSSLGVADMELLLIGGITYSVGALIYASKRPDPFPKIFGYHEIFHVLVVIASVLYFKVIYGLTT